MPTLTTFIQHTIGSPSQSNQKKKKIKGIQSGKEVKLSLFADDTILHIENPKDATRKLLQLINEFSKFVDNKINIEKSVACLYIHNKRSGRTLT